MSNERLLELKNKLFLALAEYEYEEQRQGDKTRELSDTISKLMVKKADLEDRVLELADTIVKLSVQKDVLEKPASGDKPVIHG